MSVAELTQESATPVTIDPRSFHVFQFNGERLLFDRATGSTSTVSELAFEVLHQVRHGFSVAEAAANTASRFEDANAEAIVNALADLKKAGFFRFEDVSPKTEEDLDYLWTHKPRRVQLLMAEGCNLGCRYCYQWRNGTNQLKTLMPWNIARTSIDYLMWRSGGRTDLQVTFFGGEPLLNYPMIRRVVEYCRSIEARSDKKFLFELITNGTLLTPDVVNFLIEHRFLLFISLDGDHEMHSYNRPSMSGEDLYDTIVKNAQHANAEYTKHKLPRIKVRANLTKKYHDSEKVAKVLESLGFSYIGIGAIEPLPHGNPSPSSLTQDQMDELHDSSTRSILRVLGKLDRGEPLSAFERKRFSDSTNPLNSTGELGVTCGVCRNTTVVDNRGNMYPCHRYGEMEEYRIGNVTTGLDRRLVMEYYQKINARVARECHDCWIRDYCRGGCAWLMSDSDGKIHHPDPRECRRRRLSMERGLWLRKELRQRYPEQFETDEAPAVRRPAPVIEAESYSPGRKFDLRRTGAGDTHAALYEDIARGRLKAEQSASVSVGDTPPHLLPILNKEVGGGGCSTGSGCDSGCSTGCGSENGDVITEFVLNPSTAKTIDLVAK